MPVLSGFLPIPLAMMIPFMGAQSLVLGKSFGEGFQYGKRKISAMTNEEFNKLTPSDIAENSRRELQQMIPSMQAAITDMRAFQSFIVKELIETAKQLPSDIFSGALGTQGTQSPEADLLKGITNLIPNIPTASAETGGQQKFVTDYLQEARNLPFALLASIVEKMLSGKLQNPIERRIAYIQIYKERLPPKSTTTPEEAITVSGATGLVKQIAQLYSLITNLLRNLRISSAAALNKNTKLVLNYMKGYNVLVARNGKSNLQIDTAKSLAAFKPIPKT